jgi:ATP-dependent Clp protease ATP-binding subunit ClpC
LASKRSTLSRKIVSDELALALNQAAGLMRRKKLPVMMAEILLLAFITTPETTAYQLLQDFSRKRGFSWDTFARDTDRAVDDKRFVRDEEFDFVTENQERISLGREVIIVLDDGLTLGEKLGEARCGSVQALTVMADIRIGTHWLLNRRGITQQSLMEVLAPAPPPVSSTSGVSALAKERQAPLIYPRKRLQDRLVNLLSMTRQRHVILVGPAGVGKRSLVLGLQQLIRQGQGPVGLKSVVELEEQALLGSSENALKVVQQGIKQAGGGILFVPDIARFFGGIRSEFGPEVGNLLQRAFFTEEVVIIGTATEEAYNEKLSSARPIVEQSQILRVPPATVEETVEILKTLRPGLEADYGVAIVDKSLEEAARLAGRYYTAKPLPDAAVYLLHQTGAMLRTKLHGRASAASKVDNELNPDEVMIAASMLTGIPVSNMGADERNRYVNMADHLHRRIIGQNEAVLALSRAVKMARVGLKDPKRPIGSFMFLGPTGVGKSELAKALAEFMFGTEQALITLDMSEFMEASSVNRLIGSPPGYVGYQSGGQLTDAVKKQPYSVILFDEVEKADAKVFDTLLQVMDEGRLTSGQGETVSFRECVILMTSNIGGHHLADPRLSEGIDEVSEGGHFNEAAYRLNNIRSLLDEGFSLDELISLFCSDPLFRAIQEDLLAANGAGLDQLDSDDEVDDSDKAKGLDKSAVIEALIQHAEAKAQFDLLLELAEKYNSAKFELHKPYYNWVVACEKAAGELKSHFRPEFLNRLDDIIYFHPLRESHLRQILDLLLDVDIKLMEAQNLNLKVTGHAKSWLLKQNDHPEWGARPLRRLIQRYIREPMADFLLRENPEANTTISMRVKDDVLTFEIEK